MAEPDTRQADATIGRSENWNGRGVWVKPGETAREIMEGAKVLEEQFDVAPFISRLMVSAVLSKIRGY